MIGVVEAVLEVVACFKEDVCCKEVDSEGGTDSVVELAAVGVLVGTMTVEEWLGAAAAAGYASCAAVTGIKET